MAITAGVQYIHSAPIPPGSGLADWTAVGPGKAYLRTADPVDANGNIVDPDTITASSRQVFGRKDTGAAFLGVRMSYDTKPVGTDPVIKVFGATAFADATSGGLWQILKNRLKDSSVTINTDPSDILDAASTNYSTTADPEAHYFDLQGCNRFLIGVEIAVTDQSVVGALEVKFV